MTKTYQPDPDRYNRPDPWFRTCGRTGLKLPAIALGCWQNFGAAGTDAARHGDEASMHDNARRMLFTAFDRGITHFDLANNYGPPPGAAERRVGRILKEDFRGHRDELIISSKAGYRMWDGPYGEWGSRKYLLASLDQSLQRLGLDYIDIFYSHRPDPPVAEGGAPLEETLGALDHAVRSGKALYAGISSYNAQQTLDVMRVCQRDALIKPIIHQPNYAMLDRWIEPQLLPVCHEVGLGVIAFCPLAQGLLTDRYLDAIPKDCRVRQETGFLNEQVITPALRTKLRKLNALARRRGQSLAQMALVWVLRPQDAAQGRGVTSALIGASRPQQIEQNAAALDAAPLDDGELIEIEKILLED